MGGEVRSSGYLNLLRDHVSVVNSVIGYDNIFIRNLNANLAQQGGLKQKPKKRIGSDVQVQKRLFALIEDEFKERLSSMERNIDYHTIVRLLKQILAEKRLSYNGPEFAQLQIDVSNYFKQVKTKTTHPIFADLAETKRLLAEMSSVADHTLHSKISRRISRNYLNPVDSIGMKTRIELEDINNDPLLFVMACVVFPGFEALFNGLSYGEFLEQLYTDEKPVVHNKYIFLTLLRLSDSSKISKHLNKDTINDELERKNMIDAIKESIVKIRCGDLRRNDKLNFLKLLSYDTKLDTPLKQFRFFHQLISFTPILCRPTKNGCGMKIARDSAIVLKISNARIVPTLNTQVVSSLVYDFTTDKFYLYTSEDFVRRSETEVKANFDPYLYASSQNHSAIEFVHLNNYFAIYIDREEERNLTFDPSDIFRAKRINLSHLQIDTNLTVHNQSFTLVAAICFDLGKDNAVESCCTSKTDEDLAGHIAYVRVEYDGIVSWLEYRKIFTLAERKELKAKTVVVAKNRYMARNGLSDVGYTLEDYLKTEEGKKLEERFASKQLILSDLEVSDAQAMQTISSQGVMLFYTSAIDEVCDLKTLFGC